MGLRQQSFKKVQGERYIYPSAYPALFPDVGCLEEAEAFDEQILFFSLSLDGDTRSTAIELEHSESPARDAEVGVPPRDHFFDRRKGLTA